MAKYETSEDMKCPPEVGHLGQPELPADLEDPLVKQGAGGVGMYAEEPLGLCPIRSFSFPEIQFQGGSDWG